jgi:phosphoribosylanthranilate isomerase
MKIKTCGMRDAENIRAVERLNIDWMGFIFYPRSPRCVPAGDGVDAIRHCRRKTVGVFVDAGADEMTATAWRYGLDCVQLHGSESPATCRTMQARGYPVIKAFPVATADDLAPTAAYEAVASLFLFDTKSDRRGGSGRRFDWSILHSYQGRIPFLLSGGLAPGCADELLRFRHPMMAGADLNSGFELAPAVKDVAALAAFVKTVKGMKKND